MMVIDELTTLVRAWDQSRHIHLSSATHGSCAAYGKTVEEAVDRLKKLREESRPGFHCTRECPDYSWDIY